MANDRHPSDPDPRNSGLSLKRDSIADELVIETDEDDFEEGERILASNADGGSLTLLEEYSMRESKGSKKNVLLSFTCAAISLTFAYLIYSTL